MSDLVSAATTGDVKSVQALLGGSSIDDINDALFLAVENNHLEIAEILLSAGANPDGASILWTAATDGDIKMVRLLLSKGAKVEGVIPEDVKLGSFVDEAKEGVLYGAVNRGHLEVVRELLRAGANPNAAEVLSLAVKKGNEEIVGALLQAGADPSTDPQVLLAALYEEYTEIAGAGSNDSLQMAAEFGSKQEHYRGDR